FQKRVSATPGETCLPSTWIQVVYCVHNLGHNYAGVNMKFASVREFRDHLAKHIDEDQPVLVTRHGEPMGVYLPLSDKEHVPLEIKREAFRMGMERRAKLFGHIDEKEMLEDFEKWRKARRAAR